MIKFKKLILSQKLQIILLITGIIIGLILTAQLRTSVTKVSSYPFEQIEMQQNLIKAYDDEQTVLKSKIVSLRQEINTLQNDLKSDASSEDIDNLQQLKKDLGLTEINGKGVEIILDDSESSKRESLDINDESLIHAADLRDVINLLKILNLEFISINDQRVIISTPINCVGNSILVNSFNMLPPFHIKIITNDPEIVLRSLSDETRLPEIYRRIKSQNIRFGFKKSKNLVIPMYNGDYKKKFLKSK